MPRRTQVADLVDRLTGLVRPRAAVVAGRWTAAVASLLAVAVVGVVTPPALIAGAPAAGANAAKPAAELVPPGAIAGSRLAGRAGAEASAVEAVGRVGIPVAPADERSAPFTNPLSPRAGLCSPLRLRVSWQPPAGTFQIGGYISPLGPPPSASTRSVNGVVLCNGSTFAYAGFTAFWSGHRWYVTPIPATSADEHSRLATDDQVAGLAPAVPDVAPAATAAAAAPGAGATPWGPTIEPLAPYQPQATCDPTPKPGVVGLRDLLLRSFPGSTDLGIGQACDAPDGVSEHKEGRAFDWGVNIDDPAQRAMAEQFLGWLFAPDQYGNRYAMLRRLGIMYVIWDHHIWGSYLADEGWRPYVGVSPHTDHIHISFSWAGALGQTSFWSGHVVDVAKVAAPPGAVPPHTADTTSTTLGAASAMAGAPGAPDPAAPAPGAAPAAGPVDAAAPAPGSSPPPADQPAPAPSGSGSGSTSGDQPAPQPQPSTTTSSSTSTSTTSTSTTSTTSTTQPWPQPTLPHL